MLGGLRNNLNVDRPEHVNTDEKRGEVRNGVLNRTVSGRPTVSRAILGGPLSDGAECVCDFPGATMPN